jgi:hypothetical protein
MVGPAVVVHLTESRRSFLFTFRKFIIFHDDAEKAAPVCSADIVNEITEKQFQKGGSIWPEQQHVIFS